MRTEGLDSPNSECAASGPNSVRGVYLCDFRNNGLCIGGRLQGAGLKVGPGSVDLRLKVFIEGVRVEDDAVG